MAWATMKVLSRNRGRRRKTRPAQESQKGLSGRPESGELGRNEELAEADG